MKQYLIRVPTWTLFKVEAESPEEAQHILFWADDPMDYCYQLGDEPDWHSAIVEEDDDELAAQPGV